MKKESKAPEKRCVIVSAAEIKDYSKIKPYLKTDDFFIFCDGGQRHAEPLGIKPDLITGDFDSSTKPSTKTETIELPKEKDDTDTFFAVKEALRRGFNSFLFAGAIGNRLDHSLGNISALLYLNKLNIPAVIIDDYSEMTIVGKKPVEIEDKYAYFSLLSVAGDVKGVNIQNAKYPLKNAEIHASWQYGISNEVLPGLKARVWVKKGVLLLIKIREES